MRFSAELIALALDQYYDGNTLHEIQALLQDRFQTYVSCATVYRWVVRYSNEASSCLNRVPIKIGSIWLADEIMVRLKNGDSTNRFVYVFDEDTRFFLASYLSKSPAALPMVVRMASERANRVPKYIGVGRAIGCLQSSSDIEFSLGGDVKHIQVGEPVSGHEDEIIERFHRTLLDRTRCATILLNEATARVTARGWIVHYNFFRPHPALGTTPSEAAGAEVLLRNWGDVVGREMQYMSVPTMQAALI